MPGNSGATPDLEANGRELPWFRYWWKDEMALTVGWPDCAVVLLLKLYTLQWSHGALPADPDKIRRLVDFKPARWRIAWALVNPQFPRCDDGHRRNARHHRELTEALRKAEINRKSGSLGGQRTAEKRRTAATGNVYQHPGRGGQK